MAYSAKLLKVIGEIQAKVGKETIISLTDDKRNVDILCSTGSLGLDIAMGGGYPKGRIIEIYGPESSGKSTLAIHAVASLQKQGKIAAYIDAENSFDAFYARNLGVELQNLIFAQTSSGEEALQTMQMLCESGEVSLIILDSVASLIPKAEIEGDAGDSKVGLRARLLNQSLLKLVPVANRNDCTIVFINQLRDTIGNFYGPSETTTGGRALRFYASIRLDIRRISRNEGETSDGEKGYISNTVRVKTAKNKCFPPFREAEFDILFGKGISQESEYIAAGLKLGVLEKTNSGICFAEETPIYPSETPIETSQSKLVSALDEVTDETHLLYWVKQEIILRVKLAMNQITEEELDMILAPIYLEKEKERDLALKYLDLGSKASSSSRIVEAKYYIDLSYKYGPFDKQIILKYKTINKRFDEKRNSLKDFVIEVQSLERNEINKFDYLSGEIITSTVLEES